MQTSIMQDMQKLKDLSDRIIEEQARAARRRVTPYPRCTDICGVRNTWGENDCREICAHKFKGEN